LGCTKVLQIISLSSVSIFICCSMQKCVTKGFGGNMTLQCL
jgi:hypothetical protein